MTPAQPADHVKHPVRDRSAGDAPDVYGRPVLVLSVTAIFLAVILITCVAALEFAPPWRSIVAGVGLVALSTGLTVFVSTLMYRIAPAATAPALALLYLVKVVVMGWYLLSVGSPEWLHSLGFAITVAAGLTLSWLALAPMAMRASAVLAREYAAVVRAKEEQAAAEADSATILDEHLSEPTDGGEHGRT
ncbi:hypothetical protein IEE91_05675 [Kocuria sp. cx-455]|uniref:hypothetical protein n=1 Tax=unclassified Candidatus Sulfotelmatobacter TaxID=2635724 RepID=UPI001687F4AD|nr:MULTISPECIES: hypothetical protein [unclassified Candidatus Sulfotelmatobacter]MBD2761103.1 hypothetical protein [Kocuria sp. cx-116]MBD2764692.1 hypothetical protein [Kocuria sp. cx-455]